MKKQLMMLSAALLAFPAFGETNPTARAEGEPRPEYRQGDDHGSRKMEHGKRRDRRELTPEEKEKMQERRLAMMEKTLQEIGVSEEQQLQIAALQQQLKEQMRANFLVVEESKKKLKKLEGEQASEAEIFAAIDAVAEAQADQMKILAHNRIQMQRILGNEKFDRFMESARNKWREHGRRGGDGMPPRPELPPQPPSNDRGEAGQPPLPTP